MVKMNISNQINTSIKLGSQSLLDNIAKSPIMIGLTVLIINLGGRYLATDITQYDEKVLNNKIMKKLTIFSIAFLSTRDIKYSIIIVLLYSILFNPLGLAYKIMRKTQNSFNPFYIFSSFTGGNINSLQYINEKQKIKINKINL